MGGDVSYERGTPVALRVGSNVALDEGPFSAGSGEFASASQKLGKRTLASWSNPAMVYTSHSFALASSEESTAQECRRIVFNEEPE